MDDFDYIVVGAGSAGCVLASRLTEDGKSRVLLLEFGGSDRSMLIQMPAALSIPMNINWGFATEPEPYLGGRRLATPRGKVLGVRLRSTGWFGCAAIHAILTVGKNRAPGVGAIASRGLGLSPCATLFPPRRRARGRRSAIPPQRWSAL
jgi:hypothetical protein